MAKPGCGFITYDGKLPYSYVLSKRVFGKETLIIHPDGEFADYIKDNLKTIELENVNRKRIEKRPGKLKKLFKMLYQYKKKQYQNALEDNEKTFETGI